MQVFDFSDSSSEVLREGGHPDWRYKYLGANRTVNQSLSTNRLDEKLLCNAVPERAELKSLSVAIEVETGEKPQPREFRPIP